MRLFEEPVATAVVSIKRIWNVIIMMGESLKFYDVVL